MKDKGAEPEQFDLRSQDIAAERRQELLRLFPEIATEGGKIDFERLKLALGEMVDEGNQRKERYGMTWPGKAECFRTIQAPSLGTLRPAPEESVNFDTTENLIIEGDNLEVLKLLQKSYLGKVKMIYIDPPYNTGNDFIYPDNYTESLQTYLEYTGQVDAEGRKFGTNTDTDGRFHSKWLNMMYPRLYLARNLLREDGAICVSIDDNEVWNARGLLNEVFGEENFVATIVWQKVYSPRMDDAGISDEHDYVLIYGASPDFVPSRMPFTQNERQFTGHDPETGRNYRPRSLRKEGKNARRIDRPNLYYPLRAPDGSEVYPIRSDGTEGCWRMGPKKYEHMKSQGLIEWVESKSSGWQPYVKQFYNKESTRPYMTIWPHSEVGHSHAAADDMKRLMGDAVFPNPKPIGLLERLMRVVCGEPSADEDEAAENEGVVGSEVVLDFFAGSGTTAHAVLNDNYKRSFRRHFVLVQLPESTNRQDFSTIADITKERIRRVIKKLNDEEAAAAKEAKQLSLATGAKSAAEEKQPQDRGFRVFKLAESNFKPWDAEAPKDAKSLTKQLELHIDHIRDGRTTEDILYEILLKSGFPLATPVEKIEIKSPSPPLPKGGKAKAAAAKTVYSVAGGALLICLERELTLEVIRAMAERKPERVVCLDAGFAGNDQLKANAVQIFKTRGVTSFKTV